MTGRLVFFDLETGGLDKDRHPIIQIAAIAVDVATWGELDSLEILVQFDERAADAKALEINHYDAERWKKDGVPQAQAMNRLSMLLKRHAVVEMQSKAGKPYRIAKLAGHNAATFDGPFLSSWYKRAGEYLPADPRVLCTMQLAGWRAMTAETAAPKSLKLVDCCAHYGVELSKAHDALADVRATVALAKALLAGGAS